MIASRQASKLGSVLVLALLLGGCATARAGQPSAQGLKLSAEQRRLLEQHRAEGMRLFTERQWLPAVERFSAALQITPEDPRLYLARGWALASAGERGHAVNDFLAALRFDSQLAAAHVGIAELAKASLQRGRTRSAVMNAYHAATHHYGAAMRLQPDNPYLYQGLGTTVYLYFTNPAAYVWAKTPTIQGAVDHLTKAIQLKPDFAEAYMTRAMLRIEQRDLLGAAADAEHAIEIRPNNPEAHFVRGLVASHTANRRHAPAYARRALELDPGNPKYARALEEWQRPRSPTGGELAALLFGLFVLGAFLDDSPRTPGGYHSVDQRIRQYQEDVERRMWDDLIRQGMGLP